MDGVQAEAKVEEPPVDGFRAFHTRERFTVIGLGVVHRDGCVHDSSCACGECGHARINARQIQPLTGPQRARRQHAAMYVRPMDTFDLKLNDTIVEE